MGALASQVTSLTIVYSIVYSDADQRKHQNSASLAFVRGIHAATGEFPAQMASNAENVSIWWRHHDQFSYDDVLDLIIIVKSEVSPICHCLGLGHETMVCAVFLYSYRREIFNLRKMRDFQYQLLIIPSIWM